MSAIKTPLVRFLATFATIAVLLATPSLAFGQDATPVMSNEGHPVHVHEGTCAQLNPQPLYPLNNIVAPTGTDAAGTGSPAMVETSTTTIDATLADLTGGNRAINVHESMANIGNYIACGDIGGTIVSGDNGDSIAVGLHQMNNSGYTGIAVLQAAGNQTTITIYLAEGLAGSAAATPTAGTGHSAHMASTDAVQVEISNFAYSPASVTISAGQSVTWTNNDTVAHTVTAKDRDALQSGTLQPGDTFTKTFDKPGTYEYFCEFHSNMSGVVIVK